MVILLILWLLQPAAYKDGVPIGPKVRKSLFETFLWDSVTKNKHL